MKILYFDTETTGLNPDTNDIVQIAGIIEIDGEEKCEFDYHCQPFNYATISEAALEVNGLTIDQLKTFPKPQVVYKQIVQTLSKYIDRYDKGDKFVMAGQNVGFDAGFLREFFSKNADSYFGSWFGYHNLDLMAFSRILQFAGLLDVENVKLATLAEKFDVKLKAHNALEDIRATKRILEVMVSRYLVAPR